MCWCLWWWCHRTTNVCPWWMRAVCWVLNLNRHNSSKQFIVCLAYECAHSSADCKNKDKEWIWMWQRMVCFPSPPPVYLSQLTSKHNINKICPKVPPQNVVSIFLVSVLILNWCLLLHSPPFVFILLFSPPTSWSPTDPYYHQSPYCALHDYHRSTESF